MAQTTNFPTRPTRTADPVQQISTVWSMILWFVNTVYDAFVNKFGQGSATVTSGNTTLAVVHSLGAATYTVDLTPLADPGGRYWVTGKTSSQFVINLQVAAPVAGVPFDWRVKAA